MPVSPLLLSFIEEELSRTPSLIDRAVAATLSELQQTSNTAEISRADRQIQTEAFDTLQRSARLFSKVFAEKLRVFAMANPAVAAPHTSVDGSGQSTDFELLDESRIETDIEISRAVQSIELAAEWELRELQTFTSALIGQAHVSTDSNPLRPLVYARALWDAACATSPAAMPRRFIFRAATGCLAKQLKMAWAGASSRLESQGVEPSAYRTAVHAHRPLEAREVTWGAGPQGLGQLLARMPSVRPSGPVQEGRPATTEMGRAASEGIQFSATLEDAVRRVEALLRLHSEQELRHAGVARLDPQPGHGLTESLVAQTSDVIDQQIVELWSRLFEAILCDGQLSADVRAVMARFQVPALRIALTDSTLLDDGSHPLWCLMDRIAQAAQSWPQEADPRAASLLAFSDALATDLAATEQPTAELCAHGLVRLEEHLAAQLRAQREAARSATDALGLADRRETLQTELSVQFSEQFRHTHAAPRVLAFMTAQWPRVVTESIVRSGADSEQTAAYLQTADDLNISLNLKINAQNRSQLFSLLPRLLKRLRAGMTLIALPDGEQRALLDDLRAAYNSLLGFASPVHAAEHAAELKPASPGDPAETLGEPASAAFSESLIDVHSMDTVPAGLLPIGDSAQTMPAELTETIITGAPCQWFLRGRWQQIQLVWRSESARMFVFAGETAGRFHSITGEALMRLGREGLVRSAPDVGLLQRALERLGRKLADRP